MLHALESTPRPLHRDRLERGRTPHELFDISWYMRLNPEVDDAAIEPLAHYTEVGWKEGRSLIFVRHHQVLGTKSGCCKRWDRPLHTTRDRLERGTPPHELFDTRWYLEKNPDVAKAGINPIEHYLNVGWKEGQTFADI